MSIWEQVEKLTLDKGLNILLIVFGNIIAPYWFYHIFFPDLIEGDSYLKHFIFRLALSAPITFLLYLVRFFCEAYFSVKRRVESISQATFSLFGISSLFTSLLLYGTIMAHYYSFKGYHNPVSFTVSSTVIFCIILLGNSFGRKLYWVQKENKTRKDSVSKNQ